MQYGVPQRGRDRLVKRVKVLTLYADTAAEEIFLTRFEELLQQSKPLTIEFFVEGEGQFSITWTGEEEGDTQDAC